MVKSIIMISFLIFTITIIYIFVKPSFHSPNNKTKIIMFGRSTMSLWFKHWNWPYPLRIKTTYRPWPIPFNKYSKEKFYFEYVPIEDPKAKNSSYFGMKTLKSIEILLEKNKYEIIFFKFCFVDFIVERDNKNERLNELTKIIKQVHEIASRSNSKLILGNALPLIDPNEHTLELQNKYNNWLTDYAKSDNDIYVLEIFKKISDKDGKLKRMYSRGDTDSHPNDKAFYILDKKLFNVLENNF